MYTDTSDDLVRCPFNSSHMLSKLRIQSHIIKCRKNYPDIQLSTCFYNVTHLMRSDEMAKHLEICPDKARLEGSRYSDPNKKSSMSALGLNSQLSDKRYVEQADISDASSVRSGPPQRNNALIKNGPRGHASRYGMSHRRYEFSETEVNLLQSYDDVSMCEQFELFPEPFSKSAKECAVKLAGQTLNNTDENREVINNNSCNSYHDNFTNNASDNTKSDVNYDSFILGSAGKPEFETGFKKHESNNQNDFSEPEVDYDSFLFNQEKKLEIDNENESDYRRQQFLKYKPTLDRVLASRLRHGSMIKKASIRKHTDLLPDVSDMDSDLPKRHAPGTLFARYGLAELADEDTISGEEETGNPFLQSIQKQACKSSSVAQISKPRPESPINKYRWHGSGRSDPGKRLDFDFTSLRQNLPQCLPGGRGLLLGVKKDVSIEQGPRGRGWFMQSP